MILTFFLYFLIRILRKRNLKLLLGIFTALLSILLYPISNLFLGSLIEFELLKTHLLNLLKRLQVQFKVLFVLVKFNLVCSFLRDVFKNLFQVKRKVRHFYLRIYLRDPVYLVNLQVLSQRLHIFEKETIASIPRSINVKPKREFVINHMVS